ncbi:hypothetical protein A3715_15650 [Oleiphilus sp. HI0009]|nr:hypothetical protein A3715_15650 [Oleiphilus sp. HI0009]
MKAYKKSALVGLIVAVFNGCTTLGLGEQSEFRCNKIPDTGKCLPASEIYSLSEHSDDIEKEIKKREKDSDESSNEDGESNKIEVIEKHVTIPTMEQPVSIYNPPKIARIWVAPYIDDSGDLNMASYIYLKVKEGNWSVGSGNQSFKSPNLFPLQGMTQENQKNRMPQYQTSEHLIDQAKLIPQVYEKR